MRILLALLFLLLLPGVFGLTDSLVNTVSDPLTYCNLHNQASALFMYVGNITPLVNVTLTSYSLANNNYNCGENSPQSSSMDSCRIIYSNSTEIAVGTANGYTCEFNSGVDLQVGKFYVMKIGVSSFIAYYVNTSSPYWSRNGSFISFWNVSDIEHASGHATRYFLKDVTIFEPSLYLCNSTSPTGISHVTYNLFSEESPLVNKSNQLVEIEGYTNVTGNLTDSIFSAKVPAVSSVSICTSESANYDIHLSYSQESDFVNHYFDNKILLTNGTNTTRSIYNLNATSVATYASLVLTLRRQNDYAYFKDVYAQLQRKYPSTGEWLTVQMSRSDEFGLVEFKVKEESADYRIFFYDSSNNLILQTTPLKLICSTGTCELTYLLNPDFLSGGSSSDLNFNSTYNNATGIISVAWTEGTGATGFVGVNFTKETPTGTLTICSNFTSISTGIVRCNVASYSGIVFVQAKSFVNNTGTFEIDVVYSNFVEIAVTRLHNLVGKNEGGFWAFGLTLTAGMFGIFSPVAAVIALVISTIIVFAFGLMEPVGLVFVFIVACLGIAVGLKLRA